MLPLRDLHGVVGCAAAPEFVIVPKGAIHIGNVVKIGPSPPKGCDGEAQLGSAIKNSC